MVGARAPAANGCEGSPGRGWQRFVALVIWVSSKQTASCPPALAWLLSKFIDRSVGATFSAASLPESLDEKQIGATTCGERLPMRVPADCNAGATPSGR